MTILTTDAMPTGDSAAWLAQLAKPSQAYRRRAWLAAAALILFVFVYALLAGWLLYTAYRLTFGAAAGSGNAFWGFVMGACAAFLALFMLKGFFFVKRGSTEGSVEVTAAAQPTLFEFLYGLADAAGAPRPHRVFLSPQVNAAVFYDLSILNLLFPSRKNLEIGLALVNALSIGELRAVLAHEFGHFTQRTMAVGRWGYIAQQIAGQLVAQRDKLDDFLNGLSRLDVRLAWIGWILSTIVWSIRSVIDTVFRLVLLMQRALSREMEMHADLVAVALTGSDALVHALHRLPAADDSWQRSLNFAFAEKAAGRLVGDLFLVQARIMANMRKVMNDPFYGKVPPLPAHKPERHRLFKAELAQPPRMWLTHPMNHEREANAKRRYVAAAIDDRSAWQIFDNPLQVCKEMTAQVLAAGTQEPVPMPVSWRQLDAQFGREYLKSRYRGVYWGRSPVRYAADPDALYDKSVRCEAVDYQSLYPATLTRQLARQRSLEKELEQLRALANGTLEASGNAIRHRGHSLRRADLPATIAAVTAEYREVDAMLQGHDRLVRGWHLSAARRFGGGWPEYLRGLLAILHYTEHTEADLRDAQGVLGNVIAIETAVKRVGAAGLDRIVTAANALQQSLDKVYRQRGQVAIDRLLAERAGLSAWTDALEEFKLLPANKTNINDWLKLVDGWVDQAAGTCASLRLHALEQLLATENFLAEHLAAGTAPDPAPAPSRTPADYTVLLPGNERKRKTRLNWWGRFQTADGKLATMARFLVAGSIVGAMVAFGEGVGDATITIYNGLATPVMVEIGKQRVTIAPFTHFDLELPAAASYPVRTSTVRDHQPIEAFDGKIAGNFAHQIYNVAGADTLLEWTATYGNATPVPARPLGNQRWLETAAAHIFTEPPQSISSKSGGGTRLVLSNTGNVEPQRILSRAVDAGQRDQILHAHAQWDDLNSAYLLEWLWLARQLPDFPALLRARLAQAPENVVLLRTEADTATAAARAEVCRRHGALAAAAPGNPDLHYVASRCLDDPGQRQQAFLDGYRRWPDNGWFASTVGRSEAMLGHWPEAQAALEKAIRVLPAATTRLAPELVRIRRLRGEADGQVLRGLSQIPNWLHATLALEGGEALTDPEAKAYQALARGQLAQALQLVRGQGKVEARLLRLVAASDGAPAAAVAQALALAPEQGSDDATIWFAAALALKSGSDPEPYLRLLGAEAGEGLRAIGEFVSQARRGQSPAAAEQALVGLTPDMRGYAYAMATIVLGGKAPKAWRDGARRLLFASERPYFLPG